MITWVKPQRFCELTGETPDTIKDKRRRGLFIEGIHYKKADDGRYRYNLQRYDEWVELGTQAQLIKYRDLLRKLKAA